MFIALAVARASHKSNSIFVAENQSHCGRCGRTLYTGVLKMQLEERASIDLRRAVEIFQLTNSFRFDICYATYPLSMPTVAQYSHIYYRNHQVARPSGELTCDLNSELAKIECVGVP